MTRRRPLLLGLPAALVALGVGVWMCWPRTAINEENYAKIHKGMTLVEVEAILGGPQRDESNGRIRFVIGSGYYTDGRPAEWTSCGVGIRVWFDGIGVYSCETWTPELIPVDGPFVMLRRWLRL